MCTGKQWTKRKVEIMAKSGRSSLDFSRVQIGRDYIIKATFIVKESRKPGKDKIRYSDLEDFCERSFEGTVDTYEAKYGEIKLQKRAKVSAAK
jgi:hypothetical protein